MFQEELMRQLLGAGVMVAALFVFLGPPKKHAVPAVSGSAVSDAEIVKKVSDGNRFDFRDHMAAGRYTVFAFHADW